jgi:penicillin-binding protein 1A
MRWLIYLASLGLMLALVAVGGALYGFYKFGRDLPDYKYLATYQPPVVTRVHAADGRLLAEYARERRVFVPVKAMPRRVIKAFLAAEDKTFYSHFGLDLTGLARAVVTNLSQMGTGKRPVGASTITQQVAKNFLLSNEVSIARKAKEAILALRIERALSKDRILELYLNQIYLGKRSYGVAAAALNYFDKSLDSLTIAEAAYLAALAKGPSNYHPIRRYDAAITRRNWVLGQMARNQFITAAEAAAAKKAPLIATGRTISDLARADYFAEEVRRELMDRFGENIVYGGGLSVHTTLDSRLQNLAETALRSGLERYDRRHGWRGPIARLDPVTGWQSRLATLRRPVGAPAAWRLALVTDASESALTVGFADGQAGRIPKAQLTWARAWRKGQKRGPKVKRADQVIKPGDVIWVEAVTETAKGAPVPPGVFALRQIPDVDGGIIALDPHTGRVLAMSGGYAAARSSFNRATQARRQPGSAFKPFVYLAGLEAGFTPATRILDAPFVLDQGPGRKKWKPANYTKKFYGPTPMRIGLEKSRNLMTVRLASNIGMRRVREIAKRFHIDDRLPLQLSMALGAGETDLQRLTAAYAMLVNGGREITPSLIDRVQDRNGVTVYRHDRRPCEGCLVAAWAGGLPPEPPDVRRQIANPTNVYQVVSMLRGVVTRGTGRRIAKIGKPLAGKTGTSNDSVDTWFIGFAPDLAVGVFVGFDKPRSLGPFDSGSNVAAPVFKTFMEGALADRPAVPFRRPSGVRLVRINPRTGQLADANDRGAIIEAFIPGTEPVGESPVIGGGVPTTVSEAVAAGASGLY